MEAETNKNESASYRIIRWHPGDLKSFDIQCECGAVRIIYGDKKEQLRKKQLRCTGHGIWDGCGKYYAKYVKETET